MKSAVKVAENEVQGIPVQEASQDIWDKKYRLKTKDGEIIDETIDGTYRRVARALSEVEAEDVREHWYERFVWALQHGAIPAGRIISNAGAQAHKPATSTINCTVSGTIGDSMDDILNKVHEAGLTLKAGCVAPGTLVRTERGLVPVERAVAERHREILSYDRAARRFEMRRIERHMTTHVPREENIEIVSNGVRLTTSIKHPVLVHRGGELIYVRADDVRTSDALVHRTLPREAAADRWMDAWFAGAHLGDGSAYEKHHQFKPSREAWAERARKLSRRLIFKIRAAEREVVERYAAFFMEFAGSRAQVVSSATVNGTPVWDYTVASYEASRAAELIDDQVGRKSDTMRVPGWIAESPEAHFLPFLGGLIDTDGTVSKEHGSATIALKSAAFAHQLQELLGLFGAHAGITVRKPRTHELNGRLIHDSGGAMLKISDSAFLAEVARYMADSGKKRRIRDHASQSGQYDQYAMPPLLADALAAEERRLHAAEKQALGFYHGYHRRDVVSRIWLERWAERFPHLCDLISFARTLRPVSGIRRDLPLSETFYDFTVAGHNNYLAGNGGLVVIHNCGIGYEFSTLRPRGAYVSGAGAYTSGPLSFMDIYDKMCFTVSSAGGRRGAQMGTFDVSHPDVLDFIRAKREDGRLRQFNLSLLITEPFMEAVKADGDWDLVFPIKEKELDEAGGLDLKDPTQVVWKDWPRHDGYVTDEDGLVACKIYKTLPARRVWDMIMASTYDYAEPGFILIDKVNQMNNNWWCENIRATNPCGEQPLPPYGSCWTGAMRLNTNFGLIRTDDAFARVQQGERLKIAVDDVFTGAKTDLRDCTLVRNGEKEVFDVSFHNGQRIELTKDHRVYTPAGWREVGDLEIGDEVHVQAKELSSLDIVHPFHVGALKYVLDHHDGDQIVVTHERRRTFLKPLLDALRINYHERVKGLSVSRHHPIMDEVDRCDLEQANRAVLEGYAYAALATSARYRDRRAVYGSEGDCLLLAGVLSRLTDGEVKVTRHRLEQFRVVLPELTITAPTQAAKEQDLDFAMYGWLLADGWLTDSAGLLFSDQDDVAMELLAPRFQAMTGTDGALRLAYEGQQRDVYSIACYKQQALRKLRGRLGLTDYRSRKVRVPEIVFQATTDRQAAFLSAVFCADGSISADKPMINLVSASKEWLQDIQLLLLNFGVHGSIHSSVSKGNVFHQLLLQQQDAYRFFRFVGFSFNSHKQGLLEKHLADKQRWRSPKEAHTARVASIRSIGVQPVYDIEEFTTHTLVVNGVVVHNCLLGSVNLTKFVRDPFTPQARFDWAEYREVVKIFTRMLDDVVEVNGLPLKGQRAEIMRKRRHGMGFLGLGSTVTMLGMQYGDQGSVAFTEQVSREMALAGWEEALELADEKGPAPIMVEDFTVTPEMLRRRPEMRADGYKVGDTIPGRLLHAKYSRYMQQLAEEAPELVEKLAGKGARFTHHSSIAPTGTISLSLANNASNGIEPSFAHHYFRNVIRENRKTKEKVDVFSFELLAYRALVNAEALPDGEAGDVNKLPDYFITAEDVTPKQHVDIQAAAQRWVDSSISKTANVPTDYPYADFKDIYLYAYEQGLKGCTTFRFNPEAFQGVLVKEKDLQSTVYKFTLADGSTVEVKGDEEIEYDGEIHTAANLFDALKEGYYGKF